MFSKVKSAGLYYARHVLLAVWFLISCVIGLLLVVFRWKNPSLGAVFGRVLFWGSKYILNVSIEVENLSRIYTSQPCIYILNHQSNLDIFLMSSIYPYRTAVIGKKELKWIPVFGFFFIGSGNIMIDRSDRSNSIAGLKKASEEIVKRNISVWIFPEGTRNHGSKTMLPFKKGAFHLAISAQVPIVPIVHSPLLQYYDKSQKVIGDYTIKIKVLEPLQTTGKTQTDLSSLMSEARQRMETALNELS